MPKKKRFYYVETTSLSGEKQVFQLPKDLQEACRLWQKENPKDWQNLLKGCLINVPTEEYSRKNKNQPIMQLVFVERFFHLPKQQRKRTRGQFLTYDNWTRPGIKHFWQSVTFVQHDFKWQTKVRVTIDYYRWRTRFRAVQKQQYKENLNRRTTH